MGKEKQFWLLKTEKNLKSMRFGDLCFFYHSGPKARHIVGVVSVVREWYKDDGGVVDVKVVGEIKRSVDLKELKGDDGLKGFGLFRQPRLLVVPVPNDMWDQICELGGGFGRCEA
ncbi:Thymocyte nuclear protein 1 [Camellia lanceoleosa]|uniref:Thymocyte nuclear protein 1 n=1 Tax=Camellia lanceoleosa TaxID=1840588 RepID=A0ACC0GXD2_9ERIC|nr:Thymocyte nuclear protein 1 [Camellia lanceoleosa]